MSRALSILLIDDDPCEQVFLEDALEASGADFTLAYADGGEKGLAALESATPDILVLDLRMPGMNGFDVLKTMRGDARFAGVQVMMLSNSAIEADRREAAALGAGAYRVKPVSPDGYADLVEALSALKSDRR